ncbi:restriction endonuclease subunit S [Aeromonas veronii]|jgi:type I restriction enzyme S subunit|uniref:restriction endonuclease subunit S n=1 Tax=Aeromonas veronii TaxID=654 RepID=UPI0015EBAEB8|nr:restriction endonuclease subunit S [Aeromonas veronii]MBA2800660.1 restriction endonuclease subunit S [Aeromonas veronii]
MTGFDLPEGWCLTKIGDVCSKITDGSHNPPSASTEGLPMLSAKNIHNGIVDFNLEHRLIPHDDFFIEDKRTNIQANDVLLTIVGALGRTALVVKDYTKFTLQRSVAVLAAPHLYAKCFRYSLEEYQFQKQIIDNAKGTAQKGIYLKKLSELTLPIPPLAEQSEIANRLDTLLAQVEVTQARLARIPDIIKKFRQSVLASAVSGKLTDEWRKSKNISNWQERKLGNIVKAIEAGKNLRCIETPPNADEYGIIKISAVTWGVYDEMQSKTLPSKELFLESRRINSGDFLISRANTIELLGNPVIVKNATKNLMLSDKVLRLVMDEHEKPWVSIFLRSSKGRKEIEGRSTGNQLSMRNIGQKALLDIDIPKPSMEEQAEIVRRVEQLFTYADNLEQQAKAAKARVDNLTQAILAKAFRGELTSDWRAANPDLISGDNSAAALLARIQAERVTASGKKGKRGTSKSRTTA